MRSALIFALALASIAGCSGGTTTPDDTGNGGIDAFVGRDGGSSVDAPSSGDAPATRDMGIDAFTAAADTGADANTSSAPDSGADGGHDAATSTADAGHDAASMSTPDGGCTAITAEVDRPCGGTAAACAAGFACRDQGGIIANQRCEILCDAPGFVCPCGTTCTLHTQKGNWHQCDSL